MTFFLSQVFWVPPCLLLSAFCLGSSLPSLVSFLFGFLLYVMISVLCMFPFVPVLAMLPLSKTALKMGDGQTKETK